MTTTRILAAPPRTVLLKPQEAARAFGVSVTTLRRWEHAGKLTGVRTPGGQRRYPYQQVEQTARDLNIPWAVR